MASQEYKNPWVLIDAAWSGNVAKIQSLIDDGYDVNARGKYPGWYGCTALHAASFEGKLDAVRVLISHGADVNAKDEDGDTPLYDAAGCAGEGCVRLLLEHKADVTIQNENGNTPLHYAAWFGDEGRVRLLLEHKADANIQNKDGDTPLHFAAEYGDEGRVRLLLEHEADVTIQNKKGDTPLHRAAQYGDEGRVRLLLEHKADVTIQNEYGDTPLHEAVRSGDEGRVRLLLEHKADVTIQNKDGDSPLHDAARFGEGGVKLLLEHEADVTVQNKDGDTPLHIAARRGGGEGSVRLLLEHEADVTIQNKHGDTPLHYAAGSYGGEGSVRLLLEHNADVTIQNKNGDTPLHNAAGFGDEGRVRLLLEHKADVTIQNKNGDTPLHNAAGFGDEGRVRLLLEHKADVTIQNKDGNTALHMAAIGKRSRWDYGKIVKLLLQYGADIDCKNKTGKTPLDVAENESSKEVLSDYIQKRNEYNDLMKESGMECDILKLFFAGDGGVGKTTLLESLQRIKETTMESEEREHIPTPGIDVQSVQIPDVGNVSVWDFAGQAEYYVTHNMFLGAPNAVSILVFKATDENGKLNTFESVFPQILFWLRFLKGTTHMDRYSFDKSGEGYDKPVVMLVASRADKLKRIDMALANHLLKDVLTEAQKMFQDYLDIVSDIFLLNCRDSTDSEMKKLRDCLYQKKKVKMLPSVCAKIMEKKRELYDDFPALYWTEYVTRIKEIYPTIDKSFLQKATNYLHDIGELLFVKQSSPERKDVVVLDPNWLCYRMFGPMLATPLFAQFSSRFKRDCFQSIDKIEDVLGEGVNSELIVDLLEDFELLCQAHDITETGEKLFVIPGLQDDDMPEGQWEVSRTKTTYLGRRFECHDETDSFTAGFFPRLQTRLYKHFTELGRRPSGLWKNGIKVCHDVEGLVVMTNGRRAVNVCIRVEDKKSIGKGYKLLEMVSKDIQDVFSIACPGNRMNQLILSADSLANHSNMEKVEFYTLDDMLRAEDTGKKVYNTKVGKEEDVCDLLCQGHDTTILRKKWKRCDIKWMLEDTRHKVTMRMDIERGDPSLHYASMAEWMGIKYTDVRTFEEQARRTGRPVTDYIFEEWCRRWMQQHQSGKATTTAAGARAMSHDIDATKGRMAKMSLSSTSSPPQDSSEEAKAQKTARQKYPRVEGPLYESNFENLLAIFKTMGRDDMVTLIEEMFADIAKTQMK